MPRAASALSASAAAPGESARTTSPSWVLWTSARFTHTGVVTTPGATSVLTRRLSTNGTLASRN